MVTLLYSSQSLIAQRTAAKMVKKSIGERNEGNYASFNMSVTSIKELVSECEALSLWADKKAVVADNCFFLTSTRGKKEKLGKDDSLDILVEYCKHPNPDVDLYLLVFNEKIDEKNPVVLAIKASGGLIQQNEIPAPAAWREFVERQLTKRGASIDQDALEELLRRIHGDYARCENETRKLAAFADGGNITINDVRKLVSVDLEDDIFKMSNALTEGKLKQAMHIYEDLKVHNEDEIAMISILANSFRFLDEVRYLDAIGYPPYKIAEELSAKPFRVEIALRSLHGVSGDSLSLVLEKLHDLALSILTGQVDAPYGFRLFLANFSL